MTDQADEGDRIIDEVSPFTEQQAAALDGMGFGRWGFSTPLGPDQIDEYRSKLLAVDPVVMK